MLSDLFWDIATSYAVLGLVALIALAAFVVAHVPLGRLIPVIGQYVLLAKFVSYLALALLTFLVGFRVSDERAETRQLKTELAWSENQVRQQKASAEDEERLRKQAEAAALEANSKVKAYEDALSKLPVGGCALTDDDVRGLLDIAR